jgi:hypothetical protein
MVCVIVPKGDLPEWDRGLALWAVALGRLGKCLGAGKARSQENCLTAQRARERRPLGWQYLTLALVGSARGAGERSEGAVLGWAAYLFKTFSVLNSRARPSNRSCRHPHENKDIDSIAQPRKKPGSSNGNSI